MKIKNKYNLYQNYTICTVRQVDARICLAVALASASDLALLVSPRMLFLFSIEFSTYPPATEFDFHPPCCFIFNTLAPESARKVARCQVNNVGSCKPSNSAIFFGNWPILLISTGCILHLPCRYFLSISTKLIPSIPLSVCYDKLFLFL